MKRELASFKREFEGYQRLFGLVEWKCYFKYEALESFADITCNHKDKVATVRLDNQVGKDKHIKQSAKHEAIHLLISRLEYLGQSRYLRDGELYEETESLVSKLEKIIP